VPLDALNFLGFLRTCFRLKRFFCWQHRSTRVAFRPRRTVAVVLKLGGRAFLGGVKGSQGDASMLQQYVVGKQHEGKLIVLLLFVFDLEIR